MSEPAAPYGLAEPVAPGLRRILAPNPSPMTGTGTNSYLVGQGDLALIDPGPADERHLGALLAALRPGERITHIIVTHAHRDHSGLTSALARATGAPVLAYGDARAGRSAVMADLARREGARGTEGTDDGFRPDRCLADGECVRGDGWSLKAIHTPGHFGNHLCLQWGGQAFSGDHVMGWSTSVIAPPDGDMGAYMRSLDRLRGIGARRLWPGHGAPVEDPAARIDSLILHRRARARAIAAELALAPANARTLAARIYKDVPAALLGAAALNVFAHLVEMVQLNLAESVGPIRVEGQFRSK